MCLGNDSSPSRDYESERLASQAEADKLKAQQEAEKASAELKQMNDRQATAQRDLEARNRRRQILASALEGDDEEDPENPSTRRSLLANDD